MSAVKACVRCVGVLALAFGAYAQVYASRSGWNVQELRETAHHGTASPLSHSPFLPFLLFLFPYFSLIVLFLSFYLFSPFLCSLTVLSLLKRPQAGLLDRNKRLMSLFMWLRTSQATALAKEQPGTMETAWSRHRAGLMRKPPSCKKSLQEISSHAPLLYRQELWDYIFIPNPG